MNQICFIITDTQHKVYYACAHAEQVFNLPLDKIRNSLWLSHISDNPELTTKLIQHDISKQGFFNGFVGFADTAPMYFCDYGKRYNVTGDHIGYEMVLTPASTDTSEYIKMFYQGIVERSEQNSGQTIESIYEQEKASVEQNMGNEFSEFLLAMLEQEND